MTVLCLFSISASGRDSSHSENVYNAQHSMAAKGPPLHVWETRVSNDLSLYHSPTSLPDPRLALGPSHQGRQHRVQPLRAEWAQTLPPYSRHTIGSRGRR